MAEKKTRKTDRRTLYTRMVIKDALLNLLAEKEYADVTIADLCREAEINRGTFYLHYSNLHEVLEELFDDALGKMNHVLVQVGCVSVDEQQRRLPLCKFLRKNRQYQPLFFSDSLRSYVIERLSDSCWGDFVDRLGEQNGLSEEVLKAVFCFQLNGCLAISKQNVDIPDARWEEIQCKKEPRRFRVTTNKDRRRHDSPSEGATRKGAH
jgi:AcrR family transcriptional regulator